MWGADHTWQEVPGDGKEAGLSREDWSKISPAAFKMNGGTITKNRATTRIRGGINVVSKAVNLRGGEISDNSADMMGGGVYVATATYSVSLFNALITENSASYIGGGLWLCPTGKAEVHVTDGGAVFGNKVKKYGNEFAHDNYGGVSSYESYFATRMLGAGPVAHFVDGGTGKERFDANNPGREQDYQPIVDADKDPDKDYKTKLFQESLVTRSLEQDRNRAKEWAKLRIVRNSSYRGGGIGSNGGVNIGTEKAPLSDLVVMKKWLDGDSDALAVEKIPASVFVQLQGETVVQDKKVTFDIGAPIELNAANSWSHHFTELPTTYLGEEIAYSVKEGDEELSPVPGFSSEVKIAAKEIAAEGEVGDGANKPSGKRYEATVTNMFVPVKVPHKETPVPPSLVRTGMYNGGWQVMLARSIDYGDDSFLDCSQKNRN